MQRFRHGHLYNRLPARLRELGEVSAGIRRRGFPDPAGWLQYGSSRTAFHGSAFSAQAEVVHVPWRRRGRNRAGRENFETLISGEVAPAVNRAVTRVVTWALGFGYAVVWAIAGWLGTVP